jgi:hypothetical protein
LRSLGGKGFQIAEIGELEFKKDCPFDQFRESRNGFLGQSFLNFFPKFSRFGTANLRPLGEGRPLARGQQRSASHFAALAFLICRIFETSSFGVRHAKMTNVNPFEWIQSAAFDRGHWSNLHFVPSTADCRFGWIFFKNPNFQQKKVQSAVLSMAHAIPLSKRLRLGFHRKAQLVAS